jgi:hypothetical protein
MQVCPLDSGQKGHVESHLWLLECISTEAPQQAINQCSQWGDSSQSHSLVQRRLWLILSESPRKKKKASSLPDHTVNSDYLQRSDIRGPLFSFNSHIQHIHFQTNKTLKATVLFHHCPWALPASPEIKTVTTLTPDHFPHGTF